MASENHLNAQDAVNKSILVLTSTFPRWEGDVEPPFVYELCRRLSKFYDVHVLAPHTCGAAEKETYHGIRITRYRYFPSRWETLAYNGGILAKLKQNPWRHGLIPFFFLGQLLATIRLLRRGRFDCIHAHWLIPQGLIAMVAGFFTKSLPPVVVTSHGGDLYGLDGFVLNRLKRYVVQRSSAVTVVSQAMKQSLLGLTAVKGCIRVIPMGVDLQNRFLPPAGRRSTGVVLFVGRLVEKKGLQYLIEAMPIVVKQNPQTILRIVGAGQEMERLKKRISELELDEQVEFLGAVNNDELPDIYGSADVVVFPSVVAGDGDREGFGLVLVEALGCECAAVVTDLPAMRDVIHHETSALVVSQKDAGLLAEKINLLLGDHNLRCSLGERGRQYVLDKFDWEIVADRYKELIGSVMT